VDFTQEAKTIVTQLRSLEAQYEYASIRAFRVLKQHDPETLSLALEAFGNRKRAARWFGHRNWVLGDKTPWECMAEGGVELVKHELVSIIHGLPV